MPWTFSLHLLLLFLQELLKQSETEARQVNTLLKRAEEIQLGPKNQSLLQDQARALSEQVDKVETGLQRE